MQPISKIVEMAFVEITKIGNFDIVEGNKPIGGVYDGPMSVIPEKMTEYVNKCGYGCCFVFSAYMMNILNRYGIKNYMVGTVEDNGIRASVMYEEDGEFYIANPVEDIEYFTNHNIKSEDRESYYEKNTANMIVDGKVHNDSHFTLKEFEKRYGKICVIGSMNNTDENTLADAMNTSMSRVIMPSEKANYDVKKLIKKD